MNSTPNREAPVWASRWLAAAGIYNLLWGAVTIAFPHLLFDLANMERINYPQVWQCVGMIVGVYGVGYLIAATQPRVHWPIVLVGLLGKIFGPIGFAFALLTGDLPLRFGLTILTNDLIWWVPFTMILWDAAIYRKREQRPGASYRRFVKETRIAAPPEAVFRFHESPDALALLIPPWENMKVLQSGGSLAPGRIVVLGGWIGPLPVRWVALHTEYDPPRLFADRQEAGPFDWWYHRHQFLDDGQGGTILRDEIEYQEPLGFIGQWLGGWLVRLQLERMFAYRHETTRRVVESAQSKQPLPHSESRKIGDSR